jgi:chromatin remodeling complex protein RSC6
MSTQPTTEVPTTDPAAETPTTTTNESMNLSEVLDQLLKEHIAEHARTKKVIETLRNAKKAYRREQRDGAKRRNKRNHQGDGSKPRPLSGFATPKYISPELCEFLGVPVGSQKARTDVGREVTTYVKQKGLTGRAGHFRKDKVTLNKQFITPDDKLIKLIGNPDGLNFFSLQRELNKHFKDPEGEQTA